MELLRAILPYAQIILAILLVIGVLLQQTAAGLGGAFGGDNFSAGFHTRRGSEKVLLNATIAVAILFVILALIALII